MIHLESINKSYKLADQEMPILRDINLTILRGSYTAITGPSGSGKSTLMNIIGCLDRPSSGKYYFDARDITALTDNELTDVRNFRIGFVFQQFNLLSRLSALENVMLPMVYAGYPRPERRHRAEAMLYKLGLADRMDNRPTQLSGGQQQRVAIARALINQPDLLLADEPTGALDSSTGAAVMDMLADLNAAGLTILLVTHDQVLARCSERIIGVQDGRVVADDAR
jgi:putative ABC transport system ATP-binding protein